MLMLGYGPSALTQPTPMEPDMTETLLLTLRFTAALGCGLMAGLFFAFSVSVMGGLARIQSAQGG